MTQERQDFKSTMTVSHTCDQKLFVRCYVIKRKGRLVKEIEQKEKEREKMRSQSVRKRRQPISTRAPYVQLFALVSVLVVCNCIKKSVTGVHAQALKQTYNMKKETHSQMCMHGMFSLAFSFVFYIQIRCPWLLTHTVYVL